MRRHTGCIMTVVGLLAGSALGAGPVSADPGSLTALQNYSVSPWTGTIAVEWREERDKCDGCTASSDTDSGRLVYTVTGGGPSSVNPDWSSYQATAKGSGTIYYRHVSEDLVDECTQTWTANDGRVDGLRIGITAATIAPGGVGVGLSECPNGGSQDVVGDFPTDGIGNGPDNDPSAQRPINDEDPDPNVLRGTTTFAAQPNWDQLKAYTYTLTYDLRRASLAAPGKLTVAVKKGKARISWAAVSGAQSYQVRVSPARGKQGAWKAATKTAFTSGKLKKGKYAAAVRAFGAGGTSPPATKTFKVK